MRLEVNIFVGCNVSWTKKNNDLSVTLYLTQLCNRIITLKHRLRTVQHFSYIVIYSLTLWSKYNNNNIIIMSYCISFVNQAVVCSAFIPVYSGLIPPILQGVVSRFNIFQHACTVFILSIFSLNISSHCVCRCYFWHLSLSIRGFHSPRMCLCSMTCVWKQWLYNSSGNWGMQYFPFFSGHVFRAKVFWAISLSNSSAHPPSEAFVTGFKIRANISEWQSQTPT